MNARVLEFWYDFASPYAYMACCRIEAAAAAADLQIAWRPFLLGPIFAAARADGEPFQPVGGAERAYRWRDIGRTAARCGIAWHKPSEYPRNGLRAARIALIADDQGWAGPFSEAVYRANFVQDRAIDRLEVLGEIVAELGHDAAAVLAAAEASANKQRLKDRVARAIALGIFGAPCFRIDGELFWGQDRLADAIAWAARPWLDAES